MKKTIHIILMLFAANALIAQNANQENVLKKVDEANKVVISNPESAFSLALKAVELSKSAKNKKAEASAYNTLGTLHYNTGNYTKAIQYFTKAKNIYTNTSDSTNEEYALKYLAKSNEALGKNDESLFYNNMASQKTSNDSVKTSYRIQNYKIKKKQGKRKEAIQGLEQELQNNKSLSKKDKIDIYLELGDLYISEKDTGKGFKLIDEALVQSSNGAAGIVTDSTTVSTLNSASGIYESYGWTAKNLATQQHYENIATSTNDLALQSAAFNNSGTAYFNANDIPNAIAKWEYTTTHFDTVVTLNATDQTTAKMVSRDEIEATEKLSIAYEKAGKYKLALNTYKRYINMVDSIKMSELKGELKNELLSAKYQVQESKIQELETKQIEREKSIKRQRWTIFGLIAGLLTLLLLTYFLVKNIRQKQQSNSKIRLASLRSQMNPHFIFNSLNSVNRFISENDEVKANSYLANFSKLMRSVLNNSNKESVTLAEELKTLEIYLSLEHARFEDQFNYEIEVDGEIGTQEVSLPTMLIQPYLENAIWHGLRYKESNGFLKMSIVQKDEHLEVQVEDNGIGRQESERLKTNNQKDYTSTGISNTQERIALLNKLYQTQLKVDIEDLTKDGKASGTKVTIQIPIIQEEEYA